MAEEFAIKSAEEVRDDILRTIDNGMRRIGVEPDVSPRSDYYLTAQGLGNEIEAIGANSVVQVDAQMPDTATGEDLDRQLALKGMSRRNAGPSTGRITFATSASTLVVAGSQLVAPGGNKVTVTTGGTYANGAKIPVQSVATGKSTNVPAGTVLRWVSPPAYAASTASVADDGLKGGVDQEDDETARARLLDRIANPPGGGNSSQVRGWAEETPEVQAAFVYPAANGPSTVNVAVVAYASATSTRTRVVSDDGLAAVTSKVTGEMPEWTEINVTKSVDEPVDVSFGVVIPNSVNAIPAGTGNGWIDANPWPTASVSSPFAYVTTVTSTTNITVQVPSVPLSASGFTVHFVSPTTFTLATAKVTSWTSSGAGPYLVTLVLDTPFVGVAVGNVIWPGAVNAQVYVDAILEMFARLGPGQRTNSPGLLPRAYRRPLVRDAWPCSMGAHFLRALVDSSDEVLDASWLAPTAAPEPTLPSTLTEGPHVFTPFNIALYPVA